MPYVVSLEGLAPDPRYDELPWTRARIEEAPARSGPWTVLETKTFTDPDADPAHPVARDLTTVLATSPADWFRVVFLDAANREQPTTPVYFAHPTVRPTLTDVGALLWARTKDNSMNVLGTFTANTRPTAEQVEKLIDSAVTDVAMRGGRIPEGLEDVAREAATLRTAAAIERSYFPEQAADDNSAYALFREDYLELVQRLIEAAIDPAPGVRGVYSVPVTTDMAAPYVELLP